MKKLTVLFLIAVFTLSMGGMALAGSPWTEKTTYREKAMGKLDFGFKNTLGGWTAIFTETAKGKDSTENKVLAYTKGLGRGFGYAIAYTVGGILHIITAPIVQLDVPLPNNGVNLD